MVGSVWCRLPVASTSDLQLKTIIVLCQSFPLSSHLKTAFSAAACPCCSVPTVDDFLFLATIMPVPPFLVPSVVKLSV